MGRRKNKTSINLKLLIDKTFLDNENLIETPPIKRRKTSTPNLDLNEINLPDFPGNL